MNVIQTLRTVLALAVVALLTSCSRGGYDFEQEFTQANDTYYGSDQLAARNALETFVAGAQRNEARARKTKGFSYDRVLSMAWLQLASIHEADGEQAKEGEAMKTAIQYFDRVKDIAASSNYKSNKREALREFLRLTESYQAPEWKKKRASK